MLKIEVSEDTESAAQILAAIVAMHQAVQEMTERVNFMAGELERLQTEVAEASTVIDSAIVLIQGLAQQIRDNAANPAALTKMADDLDAKANALGAAVSENTTPPTP